MLGLLSRTIKYKNPAILTTLYQSVVRPHLEYCSATHIITRTSFFWKEYSTTLHGCFLTSDHCHMRTDYISWDCGPWMNEGTDLTWLSCLNHKGIVITHFFKKAEDTSTSLGNWWRSIVAVIHVCTSFLRESSIDGTICHKKMLMLSP